MATHPATHDEVRHLAVIMDGNGRWAQARGLPRAAGHRAGVKAARNLVTEAGRKGIDVLTLFVFSSENWERPQSEVKLLMELFLRTLRREVQRLHGNAIRISFVGNHGGLAEALRSEMARASWLTAGNSGMHLVIAVGYGGRDDIVRACRKLLQNTLESGLDPERIGQDEFERALDLGGLPEPDLFIRTGGERRVSNFLLWNLAYTELYFTDALWPDFDGEKLEEALQWFFGRQRRYGRVEDDRSVGN